MTAPEVMATVYDKNGIPLSDIVAEFTRSWFVNDVGRCTFSLAVEDRACDETVLRYGNLLHVQSNILEDWIGVIGLPRKSSPGNIDITAYTANKIFEWRFGNTKKTISSNPGGMFTQLLTAANLAGGTQITDGLINTDGGNFTETLDFSKISSEILRICEAYGREYAVYPLVYNQKMNLKANFFDRMGKKIESFYLDDLNTEAIPGIPKYIEQGEIWNSILGCGNGSTWETRHDVILFVRIRGIFSK